MIDVARLRAAYVKARDELLAERTPDGYWIGELSSSALSTATAVSALAVVRRLASDVLSTEYSVLSPEQVVAHTDLSALICSGVEWLSRQQNPDGGFGDTDLSHSNIATTYLVVAAFHLIPAAALAALDEPLQSDVVIVGDDDDARRIVLDLTAHIPDLRAFDGGSLANAVGIEAFAALLLTINLRHKGKGTLRLLGVEGYEA